ncbi:MAG: PilZ domain-containing protein [Myxococcota bacterium]
MPRSEPPPHTLRLVEPEGVYWVVNCDTEETFLFATIDNIRDLGIFIRTDEPLAVGTPMVLTFGTLYAHAFSITGRVQWVNEVCAFGENLNPGMGIKFGDLDRDDRERLVAAVRTIAYLRADAEGHTRN